MQCALVSKLGITETDKDMTWFRQPQRRHAKVNLCNPELKTTKTYQKGIHSRIARANCSPMGSGYEAFGSHKTGVVGCSGDGVVVSIRLQYQRTASIPKPRSEEGM